MDNIKSDMKAVRGYWQGLDSRVRFLDTMSIAQILLFVLSYVLMSALKVTKTVSNTAMMTFPIFMTGITFVFRSRLQKDIEEDRDTSSGRREFIMFSLLFIALVAMTFVYTFTFIIMS